MKVNRSFLYASIIMTSLLSGCSKINIEKITNSDSELINKSLEYELIFFQEETIALSKIIKAVNNTIESEKKYRFGKIDEPINGHFPNLRILANQRIIQAGRANNDNVFLILYETATAGGMMRRFLIINKINVNTYQILDDCVFPKVEALEELKDENNRCH